MRNNLYLYPNMVEVRRRCMTQAELAELYSSLSPENKTKAEERMRTLLNLQD